MKTLITKIIFFVNILFAVLLATSYLAVYVNPVNFWPLAIYSLLFKSFLLVNVFFVIYWILKKKKHFILSLLVILLGWNNLLNAYQFSLLKKDDPKNIIISENPIKVLSYNVQLFNLFGWSDKGSQVDNIFNFVKKENPDIICFQEFYSKGNDNHSIRNLNRKLKDYPYRHIYFLTKNTGKRNYGMAIYSKHRILSRVKLKFEESYNTSIYSDIKIGQDTIRVFNNHLQSVRLSQEDHRFLDSLSLNKEGKIKGIKNISYRLKEAYVKRVDQTVEIQKILQETKYPSVVCGDFNDTPMSYTYHELRKGMKDAFVESGYGKGVSFTGRKPFSFRIDFILHSDKFVSKKFKTHRVNYSDHYPISTELYLKR